MRRVFSNWFECEDGHVTVGDNIKKHCDAQLWELNYEKGKRKKWTLEQKKIEKKCGRNIVETGTIPEKLDYSSAWDYRTAHAFSIGQVLDAEFLVGLQQEIASIWLKIGGKNDNT